jgi:Mrp family chromosome partitioning ATPase
MICVLVLAAGHAWESAALAHLEQHSSITVLKRCVDVEDLLASATTGQADVALVALDAPGLDPSATHHLWRHAVRPVGVSDRPAGDLDVDELARQLGIDRVVTVGDFGGLGEVVTKVDVAVRPGAVEPVPAPPGRILDDTPSASSSRHRTIAVWGPAGAPGRTTVALNLAAQLARRSSPVVLVDLDPYGGSVAQQLGILDEVSGVLAGARLATSGHLADNFESVCRRVEDGLVVVTGIPRAERWREVRASHVDQLLLESCARGDVIVDTGFCLDDETADLSGRPSRETMTMGALEVADEIVVVGSADPVGLARLARGLVDVQERFPGTPLRVVVNRMRSSIGWSQREVAGMVEGFSRSAGLHFVPEDRAGVDRALVTGRAALGVAGQEFDHAFAGLADALVPSSAGVVPSGPRRRRLRVPLRLPRPRTADRALLR